jgi:tetratricopeptide (TPR) repeat protein
VSIGEANTETPAKVCISGISVAFCLASLTATALAQTPVSSTHTNSSSAANHVERAIDLASKGRCEESLPLLKKITAGLKDKQMKYRALIAMVRCSMKQRDDRATVDTLLDMRREFPEDPELLYMTSQFFLGIAEGASQELTVVAPNSYQTRELHAESFESQEKWAEAVDIYRKILEENPKLRGIHYRLGRAALSQPESPTSAADAKKEFEQELAIDPVNAAAEFWLGEIARLDGQWDEAITHFGAAAKIDSRFADAFLSLGTTLNSAGRFSEAVPQLERYVKMVPDNLAGHYQLSIAYARVGRKEDSIREMTLHQQLFEKQQATDKARATAAAPH